MTIPRHDTSVTRLVITKLLDHVFAPTWVRRCLGLNHRVTYEVNAIGPCWFCTTCGKDRP